MNHEINKQNNNLNNERKLYVENKTETRMMNFFNNEYIDRKLDFKPKKQLYKENINCEIKEMFPECKLLEQLFKLEEEIDETVIKSRLKIQEKLIKPSTKVPAKLKTHIFCYFFEPIEESPIENIEKSSKLIENMIHKIKENEQNIELSKINPNISVDSNIFNSTLNEVLENKNIMWCLKFQGRVHYKENDIEEKSLSQLHYRKFSFFFNKVVFSFENYKGCPPIRDIEWIRGNGYTNDTDGFEIKRSVKEGLPKSVRICYYLNNNSQKCKIINKELSNLLGIKVETRIKILYYIWQYIKLNSLQDKDNNGVVLNNKYLSRIFRVERMELNSLPNRLIHLIRPIEYLEQTIEFKLDKKMSNEEFFNEHLLDIDINIDDPGFLDITHVMSNIENETLLFPKSNFIGRAEGLKADKMNKVDKFYSAISEHDKNIMELLERMNKYKYNYDFYGEYFKDPIRFINNFNVQQDSLLKIIKNDHSIIESRFDYGSAQFYQNYEVS